MNTDERIGEVYASVFDDVHASDELKRKVRNMTETTKKKNIRTAVKVAYAAAAAAVVLVAGNIIAYASTGETLLKVFVNGVEQDVVATQDEDGSYYFTYSDSEDNDYRVLLEGDIEENPTVVDLIVKDPEVVEEGNRKFLVVDDDLKIDITDNFKEDGTAEGSYEQNGMTFKYVVDKDGSVYLSCDDFDDLAD